MERYVAPKGLPRPMPQKVMHSEGLDFTIAPLDTNWQDVSDGAQHAFLVNVHNSSLDTLPIYFYRSQRLPGGWTSSVCWGTSCYSYLDDSEVATIQPNATALLTLDLTPALDDAQDSGTVWLRVGVAGGASSDMVLLPFYANYFPSDPPIVFQWSDTILERTYQGQGTWNFSKFLTNRAGRAIDYSLSLQDSLPAGWTLKFCDRRDPSDATDTCATGNILVTNFSNETDGGTTYQQHLKFTLDAPVVTTQDSAVIYLSVHPQTSNPADAAIYRFVMIVQPLSGVASAAPSDRAGLAVTNAWPNPLVGSGALHLEILTDEAGAATAVIYDVTGTQKGTLDLGMLHEGTNEVMASAHSLPSGEYIIRVNQGGSTSEAIRINYVK